MSEWTIETMQESDWPPVREIYREGNGDWRCDFRDGRPERSGWDAGSASQRDGCWRDTVLIERRSKVVGI